ncbi:hypothetical protein BWQ96_05941 [Gracilariopsis chorda]|uniref:Uncharacterized protein n=1 Tax=Gracilariopsis chorda TaxID=448386 RepID=A0A2V3IQH4_9FLOR|nr:hypothetical protein BWQ96_05941 [Gracilariopsis chorda]|eukprot:PXF44314.1 hypothetical protein BWQ96_05941 [Gracilariopsis chorda]
MKSRTIKQFIINNPKGTVGTKVCISVCHSPLRYEHTLLRRSMAFTQEHFELAKHLGYKHTSSAYQALALKGKLYLLPEDAILEYIFSYYDQDVVVLSRHAKQDP